MDEFVGPVLTGIHDQIEALDTQMASMKVQRTKLVAMREAAHGKPAPKRRGRPPGSKTKKPAASNDGNGSKAATSREGGPTIRETIMGRLDDLNGGDIFQAELGRGLDSGYTSQVLRDLESRGTIERFKKEGANAVRMTVAATAPPADDPLRTW